MRRVIITCIITLLMVAALFLFFGRRVWNRDRITLLPTQAFSGCEEYAVGGNTYLLMHREPSVTSEVIHFSRKGAILEIIERHPDRERLYNRRHHWYLVADAEARGWVFGAYFQSYCYKYQAEIRRKLLLSTEIDVR